MYKLQDMMYSHSMSCFNDYITDTHQGLKSAAKMSSFKPIFFNLEAFVIVIDHTELCDILGLIFEIHKSNRMLGMPANALGER